MSAVGMQPLSAHHSPMGARLGSGPFIAPGPGPAAGNGAGSGLWNGGSDELVQKCGYGLRFLLWKAD